MTIVFYIDNKNRKLDGENTALGGAWQVVLCLARELAKYKNDVYVFCNCIYQDEAGHKVDGYTMISNVFLDNFLKQNTVDIFFNERGLPINRHAYPGIKKVIYHSHNTPLAQHPGQLFQWKRDGLIDRVAFVSDWHRDLALKKNFKAEHTMIIRNGFDLYPVRGDKKKNRIIWASNPKRGLPTLAEGIFPILKERMPELELHVAGSHKIYNFRDDDAEKKDAISYGFLYKNGFGNDLKDGYFYHGRLNQEELAQFFHEGTLLVYPLSNFSETGSIVVVQSLGYLTPAIVRDRCVMPELVGSLGERGYVMPDNVMEYDAWAKIIQDIIEQKKYIVKKENCKAWREKYLWSTIGKQLQEDLQNA